MQAFKSVALAPASRVVPATRDLRVHAGMRREAEIPLTTAPLGGHQWRNGLSNWMRNHAALSVRQCNSRLEIDSKGITQWMFRNLPCDTPVFGDHALRAFPTYSLAAVLAPMAGIDPARQEASINQIVGQASTQPSALLLNRAVVTRLLRALFGNDMVVHSVGTRALPHNTDNLRFWAALRGNGELWVSDARWGQTGAFLIEYPHLNPGLSPTDFDSGKLKISWDANLEKFFDHEDMPLVLTWSSAPEDAIEAPWAITPSHSVRSMLDLLGARQFEPVNLLTSTSAAPAHTRWPSTVHVSVVDPEGRRVIGAMQEKSELLCHPEAWLAGLRFETTRRHDFDFGGSLDAAQLLSVLSASVNQCPIEARMLELIGEAHAGQIHRTSLNNLPGGEWLQGVVEDLTGARCQSAHCAAATANLPQPVTLPGEQHGRLVVWVTPWAADHGLVGMESGQLHIHASGPLFGKTPATLSRSFTLAREYFPRELRVVLGEREPPAHALGRQLVFNLVSDDRKSSRLGLEGRAQAHRQFWNALLDFNGPDER